MIETKRLLLRRPEAGDLDALKRLFSDPEVMRYIGHDGATVPLDEIADRLASTTGAWEDDGFGRFMIDRLDSGETIGRVGPLAWDPHVWRIGTRREIGEHAEIELGWTLERSAWGNGFATEAAFAVRDWLLREVAPRRIISLIHPDNEASQNVARKIGEAYQHDIETESGVKVGLWEYVQT